MVNPPISPAAMGKLMKAVGLASVLGAGGFGYYMLGADAPTKFAMISAAGPLFRLMDPETTHKLGIQAAQHGLFPVETRPDPPSLATTVWGRRFRNPLGLAAGFDKDAEAIEPLMKLGFGFVEIGSVTPKPQPGNPQPRVFRLSEHRATINRYGFNSAGADAVQDNLDAFASRASRDPSAKPALLGVNLGKNKSSKDAATDYSIGLTKLTAHADYVVVNVSSPNTPGLRSLQGRRELESLVKQVKGTRDRMIWGPAGPPPLLIKIAPDLTEVDMADIAAVALATGVDGLVVSNTTITRPGVTSHPAAAEAGGLSGPPLFDLSTECLRGMYRLTGGKIAIVGCGGVSSGEDAYKKVRAGASLVQLYTALAYEGPVAVPNIKAGLAACLERDGFKSVAEAVGADHRPPKGAAKKGLLW